MSGKLKQRCKTQRKRTEFFIKQDMLVSNLLKHNEREGTFGANLKVSRAEGPNALCFGRIFGDILCVLLHIVIYCDVLCEAGHQLLQQMGRNRTEEGP